MLIDRDYDILQKRLENMKGITGESVAQQNQAFSLTDPGISQKIDAQKSAQEALKGSQYEKLNLASKAATTRMRDAGTLNSAELAIVDKIDDWLGAKPWIGMETSMEKRIQAEAAEQLIQTAHSAGLDENEVRVCPERALGTAERASIPGGTGGLSQYCPGFWVK